MTAPPTKRPADLGSSGPPLKHNKPPTFTPADGLEQASMVLYAASKLRELVTQCMRGVYREQQKLGPLADHAELAETVAMKEAFVELQHALTVSPSRRTA